MIMIKCLKREGQERCPAILFLVASLASFSQGCCYYYVLSNFSTSLLKPLFFTLAISQCEFDLFEEIYQDDGSNRKNQTEEKRWPGEAAPAQVCFSSSRCAVLSITPHPCVCHNFIVSSLLKKLRKNIFKFR